MFELFALSQRLTYVGRIVELTYRIFFKIVSFDIFLHITTDSEHE